MDIILIISILIVGLFAIGTIGGLALRINTNKKVFAITSIVILIGIFILAFMTNPPVRDDLYRYYEELHRMREFGLPYVVHDAMYRGTPITNYLFYLVSLTNFDGLLPAIAITIGIGIIFAITYNFTFKKKLDIRVISMYYMIMLTLSPLRYAISGVRNALAFSIVFLGIYIAGICGEKLSKKVRVISIIILTLIGIGIHTSSYIIAFMIILSLFTCLYRFRYILLISTFALGPILSILTKLHVHLFDVFNQKFIAYKGSITMNVKLQIVYFLILILLWYINIVVKRANQDNEHSKYKWYFRLYEYLILFTIGIVIVPTMFSRLSIIIGFMSLPSIAAYFNLRHNKYFKIVFGLLVILTLGAFAFEFFDAYMNWRFWVLFK